MAFITFSNAKKIIKPLNVKSIEFNGELYKKPIYFFSKYERNSLLAIQEMLANPEKFFKERYIPINIDKDTYTYVFEGQKPAYHNTPDCQLLNSDFINFKIPPEIKERGKEEIQKFREWFKRDSYLLEKSEDVFAMRLNLAFGIQVNQKAIKYENSGYSEIKNYDLENIESKIDSLIKNAGRHYYASNKNTTILKRFSKATFLAYKKDPIPDNNTEYTDKEVKEFLKDYDNQFKKPLQNLLIEYYRLKLNPEIKFEGYLLDQLNFKPCSKCHENHIKEEIFNPFYQKEIAL